MARIVSAEVGDFANIKRYLRRQERLAIDGIVESCAAKGRDALASATPVESGVTASSWGYRIERSGGGVKIVWTNSHIVKGVPIAIILQYGHGTGTGGYVQGRDYINPAIKPVFDSISKEIEGVIRRG